MSKQSLSFTNLQEKNIYIKLLVWSVTKIIVDLIVRINNIFNVIMGIVWQHDE